MPTERTARQSLGKDRGEDVGSAKHEQAPRLTLRRDVEDSPMHDSDAAQDPMGFTKILATLGPATDDAAALRRLLESGVNIVRLNFSHGSFDEHEKRLKAVRAAEEELGRPIGVLGDLSGPKIRVGTVPDDGIEVHAGQDIRFRVGLQAAINDPESPVFPCEYEPLINEVEPGQRVLINDGFVRTLAVESRATPDGKELVCRVTVGGLVTTRKGINLPDSDISAPAITERDWLWAQWAVEHNLDFLALSFVRRAKEVRTLKDWVRGRLAARNDVLRSRGVDPQLRMLVIAKVEKPQAVDAIREIVTQADGLMVARGDLGVEMDIARVPGVQKELIAAAKEHGKPVIVATQMLESMIERPTPTRAEVSDVANAIYDGADAVMLSGETAVGKHGPLAAAMMRRIASAARSEPSAIRPTPPRKLRALLHSTAALAHGVWHIANDADVKLVVCWSEHGGTARYVSQIGLHVPILAFSTNPKAVRWMTLLRGVIPVYEPEAPVHRSDFARRADARIIDQGLARRGDAVVYMAGKPLGEAGRVNTISLRMIGEFGTDGEA